MTPKGDGTKFLKDAVENAQKRLNERDEKNKKRRILCSKTFKLVDSESIVYFLERTSNTKDTIQLDLYDHSMKTLVVGDVDRVEHFVADETIHFYLYV